VTSLLRASTFVTWSLYLIFAIWRKHLISNVRRIRSFSAFIVHVSHPDTAMDMIRLLKGEVSDGSRGGWTYV
jgi:hypothetical protein